MQISRSEVVRAGRTGPRAQPGTDEELAPMTVASSTWSRAGLARRCGSAPMGPVPAQMWQRWARSRRKCGSGNRPNPQEAYGREEVQSCSGTVQAMRCVESHPIISKRSAPSKQCRRADSTAAIGEAKGPLLAAAGVLAGARPWTCASAGMAANSSKLRR
jgi:hypothetical protein